jgi:integrase
LRTIVRGALLTGARYSELARMHVADFHRDSGTVLVRTSKAGKVRHIELTTEGLEFFQEITAGRTGTEFLFHHDGRRLGQIASTAPARRSLPRCQGDPGRLIPHAAPTLMHR